MDAVALIVAVIALLVSVYTGWWLPIAFRARQLVDVSAPEMRLSIGTSSGPSGISFNLDARNIGNGTARDLKLVLPMTGATPAWSRPMLDANANVGGNVPVDERGDWFTKRMPAAEATLTYLDEYDLAYVLKIPVKQHASGDRFQVTFDANTARTTRPVLTRRQILRFRRL